MNKSLNEPRETALKRLKFRSWHRGCKETDLILGTFCDTQLESLDEPTLTLFTRLLDEEDSDIWDWLVEKTQPNDPAYLPLLERLRAYAPKTA